MKNIVAIGEILIDYTSRGKSENGMSLFEQNPGGAPANVIVALARLGIDTAFIGKVGKDFQGALLKRTLEQEKVNVENLIVDENFSTTFAFVDLDENGDRSFSFARKHGADLQIRRDEVNEKLLKEASVFHFGSLSMTKEPSREATIYSVKKAKEFGAIISYDPNYRELLWESKEYAKYNMQSVLSFVDVIKISEEECVLVAGETNPYIACEKLQKMGIKIVLITLGAKGCVVGFGGKTAYVPEANIGEVVDTTGAGDSFFAGFLYNIADVNLQEITFDDVLSFAKFGNIVAALCIQKYGAIPAMPYLEDVKKYI